MAKHAPGFLRIVADAKTRVKECTVDDVLARQQAGDAFTLIDVREESEYAAGHLPGAGSRAAWCTGRATRTRRT